MEEKVYKSNKISLEILKELKDQNCSQIILGCTELPLILDDCLEQYDELKRSELVDTSANMVETLVRLAKGDLDLDTVMEQVNKTKLDADGDSDGDHSTDSQ